MELLASLLMFGVAACWLRPAATHGGQDLEWRLLSAPLAAAALLIWLELHGDAGLLRWALSVGACAAAVVIARSSHGHALLQRPVWTVGSIGMLAAGLLWNVAGAQATRGSCGYWPTTTMPEPLHSHASSTSRSLPEFADHEPIR